jgi:hypothetical protein
LFALLVQVVTGFGHFHPEDFGSASGLGSPVLVTNGGSPLPLSEPVNHHSPGLPSHDDCAICIVLHLTGSAGLPVAPLLVIPTPGVTTKSRPPADLRVGWPPHFLFDPRGPPHA